MQILTRVFVGGGLLGAVAMVGCSANSDSAEASSDEYDPLYTVAQAAAPNTDDVVGLWKTSATSGEVVADVRIQFRDGRMQIATRCSSEGYETVTTGVTVAATIGAGTITITDKGGTVVKTSKGPAGKPDLSCKASLTGPGSTTYALGDNHLQLQGFSLTKVAD